MGILLIIGKAMVPFLKELLFGGRRGHTRLVRNKWLIVSCLVIFLLIATHFLMLETLMSYDKKVRDKDAEIVKLKETFKANSFADCDVQRNALTVQLSVCLSKQPTAVEPHTPAVTSPTVKSSKPKTTEDKLSDRLAKIHD